MKSKVPTVRKIAPFAAVLMLIVVIFLIPRSRGECSKTIRDKFRSRGITDAMLIEFADDIWEQSKRNRWLTTTYITPAMQVQNAGPIWAAFDKERPDIAAAKLKGDEWIIVISLCRTRVWEREGQLVLKPTFTSREAFNEFVSHFSGRKVYSENIVGVCIPPKM